MINKELIKKSFKKSISTYNENALAQKLICEKLVTLALHEGINYNSVLEIGCGTGILTNLLLNNFKINNLYVNDLVKQHEFNIRDLIKFHKNVKWQFIEGDIETVNVSQTVNLIISASTIQWLSNVKDFFTNQAKNLQPSGLLIFNTYGPTNLHECKSLSGNGLNYQTAESIKTILNENFEIINCFEEKIQLKFNTVTEVIKHLQLTGVNGIETTRLTRLGLLKFINNYKELYTINKKLTLTYHPIYFVAKKINVN